MPDAQERTEKASPKKLREARQRGQVAKSRDIVLVAGLVGGALALYASAGLIYHHFRQLVHETWGGGFELSAASALDNKLFLQTSYHLMVMIAPLALVVLILAVAGNLVQIRGFILSFHSIEPELKKIDPIKGFGRIFSLRSLVEFVKSVVKLAIVGYAVYAVVRSEQEQLLLLVDQSLVQIFTSLGQLAFKVLVYVVVVMAILSALDFFYQRWQHQKDLMMSKQEVKQEFKETEGDPQVKARIRSIQNTIARRRMMADVPKAQVVITNPTHFAVALSYNQQMEAPQVVAKGMNLIALKIIEIARSHRVVVVQNPPLAQALYKEVKTGESIPASLYKAVAKVLAYVYQQEHKATGNRR